LRTILNADFYVLRTGGAWRLLPKDLPAWQTVNHYFRAWRLDGTWERLHTVVRERLRVQLGRDPQPSAGIIARLCSTSEALIYVTMTRLMLRRLACRH
jgi:transposase